jgi:hypothetical protein
MMRALDKNGMSSDSDCYDSDGNEAYAARPSMWRHPLLGSYMKELDRVHRSKARRGGVAKRIFRDDVAIQRKGQDWWNACMERDGAMVELPVSLYNPQWLELIRDQQPAWVRHVLKPRSERFSVLDGDENDEGKGKRKAKGDKGKGKEKGDNGKGKGKEKGKEKKKGNGKRV